MVYSSLYFCVGEGQGMEELAKTVDVLVKNWLMVLWSLTHSLFSLSRSLSLYLSLFLYPVSLTLLPVTLSASLTAISTSAFCNSKQKLFLKNKIQRECILLCVISFLCAKSSSALNLHVCVCVCPRKVHRFLSPFPPPVSQSRKINACKHYSQKVKATHEL